MYFIIFIDFCVTLSYFKLEKIKFYLYKYAYYYFF